MANSIEELDDDVIQAVEDKLGMKVRTLPDHLKAELLVLLGDPVDPDRVTDEVVDDFEVEIQDRIRKVLDARFAREILKVSRIQRRELINLMGTPPSIDNVPSQWWGKAQKEIETALVILLTTAYGLSAKWHGIPESVARIQAEQFALQRARRVAAGWVNHTRRKVRDHDTNTMEKLTRVLSGTEISDDEVKELKRALTPAGVRDGVKGMFDKSRAKSMSVTEVTMAITMAGELSRRLDLNTTEEDIWYTKGDTKVCPVCEKLHRKPRSVWAAEFPGGPPAHPECRCRIRYKSGINR